MRVDRRKTASGLSPTVLLARRTDPQPPENALAKLSMAVRMLAEASTLDEVTHIRSLAKAAEEYARAEKLGTEAIRSANEVKLRAARKGGELLKQMAEDGRRRKSGGTYRDGSAAEPSPKRLEDLGITKKEAYNWQHIAELPEDSFNEALEQSVSEHSAAQGITTRPEGRRHDVPLGNMKRSGTPPSARLQKVADALAAMAVGLPNLNLRGQDCSAVLAEIDRHLADIRRAVRLLQGRRQA